MMDGLCCFFVRKMKVLHISTIDGGGAGLAAYRLHKALLKEGIDSLMLVAEKTVDENTIIQAEQSPQLLYQPPQSYVLRKFEKVMRRRGHFLTRFESVQKEMEKKQNCYPNVFFTSSISTYDLSTHPLVQEADIIHLHWIQNFLNFDDFFEKVKKPIVWTLHDLNPMFGGFHHVRLRDDYYEAFRHLEDEFYEMKKRALKGKNNVSLVAISSQMHQKILDHEFFEDKPIFDIYNSVDAVKFRILDRQTVRTILGLPSRSKVVLFVNRNLNDGQKGLSMLVEALGKLKRKDLLLVCVGSGVIPYHEYLETRQFLPVSDSIWLSVLYSAADCLALPSYQEAFSQTSLEAMCCGTPVVMTPVSGSDDLIADFNGVRCDDFSIEALAKGISAALEHQYDRERIHDDVVARFGVDTIVKSYLQMYQEVLANAD